ncbi:MULTISPECIES: hypothetical protein [unclassified Crossiella]|uniref:hypothetical protein n=1 Tax=unclassified Crossiella TaxID=2620835 RepID=UPI001FFE3719|nr:MULTISPECIES: hypothetical protein [unclassified Crossiella]MCK2245445.1 hypothetical protein [Crossiella sp. S99.2]MCK2259097.1 hypothetical protein [Crossiella sp. S99.1]
MTAESNATVTGCACRPAWPELVVTRDDGTTVAVLASDTPGPLALLYYAHCVRCGIQYPGPFRLPPRTTSAACRISRSSPARRWQTHCLSREPG